MRCRVYSLYITMEERVFVSPLTAANSARSAFSITKASKSCLTSALLANAQSLRWYPSTARRPLSHLMRAMILVLSTLARQTREPGTTSQDDDYTRKTCHSRAWPSGFASRCGRNTTCSEPRFGVAGTLGSGIVSRRWSTAVRDRPQQRRLAWVG